MNSHLLDSQVGRRGFVAACARTLPLFGVSFATTLFALAMFRLAGFFLMPSLLFDLLFIGYPIGAVLAARRGNPSPQALRKSLWLLLAIMVATPAAALSAKEMDYLRANMFNVDVHRLLVQIGVFAAMLLPFFAGQGMCEFLGYRMGDRWFGGRVGFIYSAYLFGAAGAYFAARELPTMIGMARTLLIAVAVVALALAWFSSGRERAAAAGVAAAFVALGSAFDLEPAFLSWFKGHGAQSAEEFRTRMHCRSVYQKWGKYALVEILASPDGSEYHGFYNDLYQWSHAPDYGWRHRALGVVPILESPRDAKIAIVGSGGGRQVRLAQRQGRPNITAIEIEPAVWEAVRDPRHLLIPFRRVYDAPGVRPIKGEARSFFEATPERFDLIYLPSVGGYPQMMIEPGNMIRTIDAYRLLRDRLTDRGCLAIWYPKGLDPDAVLTRQYVLSLRTLDMKAEAFHNEDEFLILSYKNHKGHCPSELDLARHVFFRPVEEFQADPASYRRLIPVHYPVEATADFAPISDDRPFLAGNVRHILSPEKVVRLAGSLAAIWIVLSVAAGALIIRKEPQRRGGEPGAGAGAGATALMAFLVGLNFVLAEHLGVLHLFRTTYVYADAISTGALGFLILSGIGGAVSGSRVRVVAMGLAVAGLAVTLAFEGQTPRPLAALGLGAAAFASGTFFPRLFERAGDRPLTVFAFDAVGAGAAALIATFTPILFGFRIFTWVAASGFAAVLIADAFYHHKATASAPFARRKARKGAIIPMSAGATVP